MKAIWITKAVVKTDRSGTLPVVELTVRIDSVEYLFKSDPFSHGNDEAEEVARRIREWQ